MTKPLDAPGPRVLIVDDDQALRHFLRIALSADGYSIVESGTAAQALDAVTHGRPDVIVLDLGLPDRDGVEVTRRLREWTQTPIVILSVRDQEEEKIAALEAGADDYLTKPFGVGELRARLGAVLRRAGNPNPGVPFRTGALEVDLTRRVVKLAGTLLSLTPTEYGLLKALVQAGGKVLTHQQLLRQVWGPQAGGDSHLLRVNISTLRRKLRREKEPSYVVTESRVGYRLRIEE
jgi:two-component system, OmpR family, KDP operon response regulator KdpE